jgi:hypothetical protein
LAAGLVCIPQLRWIWWLGLLVDYGTLVTIIGLSGLCFQFWSISKFNRLHQFYSHENGREIEVNLYRRGLAVIKLKFEPPKVANIYGAKISSSSLVGDWHQSADTYEIRGLTDRGTILIKPVGEEYLCKETEYSKNEFSHDNLDGVQMSKR